MCCRIAYVVLFVPRIERATLSRRRGVRRVFFLPRSSRVGLSPHDFAAPAAPFNGLKSPLHSVVTPMHSGCRVHAPPLLSTLAATPPPPLGRALRKARRVERRVGRLGRRRHAKAELARVVVVVGVHRQRQAHVEREKRLRRGLFLRFVGVFVCFCVVDC